MDDKSYVSHWDGTDQSLTIFFYFLFFMDSSLMQSKKQSIRVRPNSQTANVEAAHNNNNKKRDKWQRDNKEKSEYNKVKFYLVHVQR